MPKYIPFTDAQKEQAASVDLEEFLRRRGRNSLHPAGISALPVTTVSPSVAVSGSTMPPNKVAKPLVS